MEHILTPGASPLHKHPVLQHPFLNSASIQLPFCTTALFATPICTFYGGSRFLLAMATPKLSVFRYVKVKCVDFSLQNGTLPLRVEILRCLTTLLWEFREAQWTRSLNKNFNEVLFRLLKETAKNIFFLIHGL